jgi:hypothetical protein
MSKAHPHQAHCREEPRGAELFATVWRSRRYSFTTNRKTQRRKTKTIRFSRNAMSRFVLRGQRLVVMPAYGRRVVPWRHDTSPYHCPDECLDSTVLLVAMVRSAAKSHGSRVARVRVHTRLSVVVFSLRQASRLLLAHV